MSPIFTRFMGRGRGRIPAASTGAEQKDPRFLGILAEMTEREEHVVKEIMPQYAPWKANFYALTFRLVGMLIILLSVSVSALSLVNDTKPLVPWIGILLAVLTSLNTFFQWQLRWYTTRETRLQLEYLIEQWKLQVSWAKYEPDATEAIKIVREATNVLIDAATKANATAKEAVHSKIALPSGPAGG